MAVNAVKSTDTGILKEGIKVKEKRDFFALAVSKANGEQPAEETPPGIAGKVKLNGAPADAKDPALKEIQKQMDAGKAANDIWFEAVKNKDVDIVKAFIKYQPEGWSVHAVDNAGRSALHWAVLTADEELVEVLVGDGRIDMALIDEGGDSAYELAAETAVNSNGGAFQRIADYLKEALSGEAVAAYENGDVQRRNVSHRGRSG